MATVYQPFKGVHLICDPFQYLQTPDAKTASAYVDPSDQAERLLLSVEKGARSACVTEWKAEYLTAHPTLGAMIYVPKPVDGVAYVWCFYIQLPETRAMGGDFELLCDPLLKDSHSAIFGKILGYFCPTSSLEFGGGVEWMVDDTALYAEQIDFKVVSNSKLIFHKNKLQRVFPNSKVWFRQWSQLGKCSKCQREGNMAVSTSDQKETFCSAKCYHDWHSPITIEHPLLVWVAVASLLIFFCSK